ncbi:retropepsin-like aspartic protease [Acinetobacter larvae]|nr:aspartyl protease family protein [Acinetobacter larvae]
MVISTQQLHADSNNAAISTATTAVLTVPFEESLIIPVKIADQTYHFLVDTGASVTVIDKTIASQITQILPLNEMALNYQKEFAQVSAVSKNIDTTQLSFLKPVAFTIGTERVEDNDVWIASDLSMMSQLFGVKIDGMLGIDSFRKFNWVVDNNNKQLTILKNAPSAHDFEQCLGYEDMYHKNPQLYLGYAESNIRMSVDTGADVSYMGNDFFDYLKEQQQNIRPISQNAPMADMTGLNKGSDYIITALSFNDMPLGEMRLSENHNSQYALGMDFFSRFQRYAFMPSRMMMCFDGKSIARDKQMPLRHIAVRYFNDQLEIYYNEEQDIKALGLKNGDVIVAVNGVKYQPRQIDQLRKVLALTAKGQLELTILRGNKQRQLKL